RLPRAENVQRGRVADDETEDGDAFALRAAGAEEEVAAPGQHGMRAVAAEHRGGESRPDQPYAGGAFRPRVVFAFHADGGAVRAEAFRRGFGDGNQLFESARIDKI